MTLDNANTVTAKFIAPTTTIRTELTFKLIVTDDDGAEASDTIPITVALEPIADASEDITVNQGDSVVLNGTGSYDEDGTIASYEWAQIEGTVSVDLEDADTASAYFDAPETDHRESIVFELIVTDDEGLTNADTVKITINVKPNVEAGTDQTCFSDNTVTLVGSSSDSDGTIETYYWEQTSGSSVDLINSDSTSASFVAPSSTEQLTFSLTVTDNDGGHSTDTVSVYVNTVLFSDSFYDNSSLSNWDVEEESGSESDWCVRNGKLYQLNNVNKDGYIESYKTGTFAYIKNSILPSSSSFRFSVDVVPRSNNNSSSDGNDIGIMFPYTSLTEYYRLSMNARWGYTRLEKRVGQTFKTLAVNSIGYVDDESINFTIEVDSDKIIVMINDEIVFAEAGLDITPGTIALYSQDKVSFDNVVVSDNSLMPMVGIVTPIAYSMAVLSNEEKIINADAVVFNKPDNNEIVFELDNNTEVNATKSGVLYSGQFTSLEDGEHEISVKLRDGNGNIVASDSNSAIGVGGNYFIAVGDSITNGTGDDDPDNNSSLDGRTVGIQGYAAELNDALTNSTGLPQIIFNEGIPGDTSEQLNIDRIDSILERHPKANRMLLLIGTNDAWKSLSVPVDNYETNITQVINVSLIGNIEKVYIAEVLPFYNSQETTLNSIVESYNARIEEIADDSEDDVYIGPNFYNIFTDQYPYLYSSDGVHPNDSGYQVISTAWHDILTSE